MQNKSPSALSFFFLNNFPLVNHTVIKVHHCVKDKHLLTAQEFILNNSYSLEQASITIATSDPAAPSLPAPYILIAFY